MALTWKKPEKPDAGHHTSIQVQSWRQRVGHEKRETMKSYNEKIKELEDQLHEKNTYLHHFRTDKAKAEKSQTKASKQSSAFMFDKVFEMDQEPEDMMSSKPEEFDQKNHRESKWSKNRIPREDAKQTQTCPITTAQAVGWRENYDSFTYGNARVGHCKRTFHDQGHL
jgi:hypothetical protein